MMKYDKHLFLSHLSSPVKMDYRKLLRYAYKVSQHLLKSRSKIHSLPKDNTQRKIHLKRHVSLLCLSLSLTGCMGIYEGGFECPAGTGVGCKSISDVNVLVNKGEIPKVRVEEPPTPIPEIWYAPGFKGQWSGSRNQEGFLNNSRKSHPSKLDPVSRAKKKETLSCEV